MKNDKDLFYLESSKKLISFFNNTLEHRNDCIDLIMSSPTGCMVVVEVMKSYYLQIELTKQNLVRKVVDGISFNMNESSVYKMINKAIDKIIFQSKLKNTDRRVRLILPTEKTLNDMGNWFDKIKLV